MNDRLVSLEVAKLLKEKGFDEVWCNHIYCIGYNTIPEDNELLECDWRNNVKGQFHLALAPTQSLAQKWLREKHEIYLAVLSNNENAHRYVFGEGINSERYAVWYKTYEEALEEGLRVGLNLIE